jgi:hypothetical protein
MKKVFILGFLAVAGPAMADNCPLPNSGFSSFTQGLSAGGFLGAIGAATDADQAREQDCAMHRKLVTCGMDSDAATLMITNKQEYSGAIIDALGKCSSNSNNGKKKKTKPQVQTENRPNPPEYAPAR